MECSIKAKKVDQAMKNYKRAQIFLYNFILYSLTSLIIFFFFSYQFSFPLKNLLFSLPKTNINYLFSVDAKCLFIVANLIIFILVRESKVARSSNSSPVSDIYDEYIARSQINSIKVNSNFVAKEKEEEEKRHGIIINNVYDEEKKKEMRVCNSMRYSKQEKKGLRMSKSEVWGESEIMKMEKMTKGGKESQVCIPKEELNKRVEAFIARVNKQRLLEAELVDHSRG
ncbi:hypothetical protein PHJA_002323800 [Phtheirospermum japonicum]|uniref:DUF4408 domain-containing protein n=1 Tax=Phtheirospermum japonicum TaxID=374723 RepID=A0A830CW27_9LAMI|nr:hypothetical protein PHJA_002323800 [Phtheirospermum japonicum]